MSSLTLASQIIGFISFSITLLTLLGVYRDLISTMRTADKAIPLELGNLRQEIDAEKVLVKYRMRQGDPFRIFRNKSRSSARRTAFNHLLDATIKELWQDFKKVERPFLIQNPTRAEAVRKGDYWGESDIEEKLGASTRPRSRDKRVKDRMGMAEAGLSIDQQRYYRTDMAHRFIWWQSTSEVERLLNEVQRVQIRRIERDAFEADELVKRCLRILEGRGTGSGRSSSRSGSGSDGGGGARGGAGAGGGVSVRRRRSAAGSRAGSVRMPSRRPSATVRPVREYEETETMRRKVVSPSPARPPSAEPRNPGPRRRSQPRYEYEVVQPGRIWVDMEDSEPAPGRGYGPDAQGGGRERARSYSRDRDARGR